MRRLGVRLLMVAVGLTVFVFYGAAAVVAYLVLRWLWLGRPGLASTVLVVVGLTVLFGYLTYQFGTARLLAGTDAAELPRERARGFYRRVERLAGRADAEMPRLLVANVGVPNAFALGSPNNGFVVLDTRLFGLLGADELEAIVAHEIAHLESHDGLVQTIAYTAVEMVIVLVTIVLLPLALLLTGLSRALAWIRGRPLTAGSDGRFRRGVAGAVGLVFLGLLLLVRAHSRRREFAADDRAVELTGKPAALARALWKIERASEPRGLLAHLYVHGDEEGPLTRWLSSHPSMDDRVDRLADRASQQTPPGGPGGSGGPGGPGGSDRPSKHSRRIGPRRLVALGRPGRPSRDGRDS